MIELIVAEAQEKRKSYPFLRLPSPQLIALNLAVALQALLLRAQIHAMLGDGAASQAGYA